MKFTTILVAVALCVALVSTSPVPQNEGLRSQALERLVMVEGDNAEALRSKRTIGVLRQLFPGISQIVEQKVSAITSEIIRILGPVILRNVLGGGGGGGGANSKTSASGGTTVELPIPDDDDDDDSSSASRPRVSISLPTFPPDEEDDFTEAPVTTSSTTTTTTETSETTESTTTTEASVQDRRRRRKRDVEWKRSDVNPEAQDRQIHDTAESQNNEVRVQFADDQSSSAANEAVESELAPLEDIEVSDDENRNKRFLNFGFGASGGAGGAAGASSGSGGGSGNFLFDIIRLVAGSGSSQATDVAAGAPSPGGRNDGTAEAVPGPVTRLFVIANRGISNLIQDLILRLAATSERIVNFKARLITSII